MAAGAQQRSGVRWVGVLMINLDDQVGREVSAVFEQSLEKLGWAAGRNLAIDYRWGVSDLQRGRAAVAQILRLAPDVILANGGRVLNICASGKSVTEAQRRAYDAVDRIRWPEGFCRRDIGWEAVEREKQSARD